MLESEAVDISRIGGVVVVTPGKCLAHLYEHELGPLDIVGDLALAEESPRILIDLPHVKFLGSAFLGRMVTFHKAVCSRKGGRFGLCSVSSDCLTVIQVAKLDQRFEIFATLQVGVQAFQSSRE